MEKKTTQTWITFETKITELEINKSEMMKAQTQFQEKTKSAILEALVRNDFDAVQTLTEELKAYKNGDITDIENKIQCLKDRQQKIRGLQERDSKHHESVLKDDVLYMHAIETNDQKIVELFKQRKISEELYQNLMDAYYGNIFDLSNQEWWRIVRKKQNLIASDQDIWETLKYMWIKYNNTRVEEFYEQDSKEWWKKPSIKPSKQINFIKEWNIIQELLMYIQASNVSFDPSEIILDKKWTTMYIYIEWINKTVLISNVYWIWTHIYQWRVNVQEIQNGTISSLCKKYHGKRINFWSDFWWIEWWKCRFIKIVDERTQAIEEGKKENEKIPEKKYRTLREKIKYFSLGKHISRNNLNFEDEYDAIVTSKKTYNNWLWTRMYMSIWDGIFGFCCYRNSKDADHISIWSIVKVKLNRIWWKKSPIVFTRPEKLCVSN